MYWVLYHIVSGHAFFTGLTMVMLSVLASTGASWLFRRLTGLLFLVGLLLIVVGAAPLPWWPYIIFAASTSFWAVSYIKLSWRKFARWSVVLACLILIVAESPYHFNPSLSPRKEPSITVIGDSVTAGLGSGDKSETWPQILANDHNLNVQDISHVGETVASALKRSRQHFIESELVIIEIGGNDVLGSTTPEKFAAGLESLVEELENPNRQLLMFELPVPPFYTAFGKYQRDISAKHGIKLIPKRHFYSIIGKPEHTVDGVHLSQQGHNAMSKIVWKLIR